jgi:hypothetical protein
MRRVQKGRNILEDVYSHHGTNQSYTVPKKSGLMVRKGGRGCFLHIIVLQSERY